MNDGNDVVDSSSISFQRRTGASPMRERLSRSTRGASSSRPAIDTRRSRSGAKSRAKRRKSPSPTSSLADARRSHTRWTSSSKIARSEALMASSRSNRNASERPAGSIARKPSRNARSSSIWRSFASRLASPSRASWSWIPSHVAKVGNSSIVRSNRSRTSVSNSRSPSVCAAKPTTRSTLTPRFGAASISASGGSRDYLTRGIHRRLRRATTELLEHLARRLDRTLNIGSAYAVVRDRANHRAARVRDHPDAVAFEGGEEGVARIGWLHAGDDDAEEDEICASSLGVEADDAWQHRQALGQATSVGVVLGEALDHPRGAVAKRDQARRGEHAHLAHPASDELARPAGAPDEVAVANDERPDRTGEAFREAEG